MNREEAFEPPAESIRAAQAVLPCAELQPNLDYFVERLGFRLERISPADDPRSALLSGHGLRLLLQRGEDSPGTQLQLACSDPTLSGADAGALVAPNGTRIELVDFDPKLTVPAGRQELVVNRAGAAIAWITGRAGMQYRDLIPSRLGGRFIASHIRIPDGGPVPDNVHYHAIRFQMIYCAQGWVRVVYEDQGPPFVLSAGDCVLQPPQIRHRVLESSDGLEVIELACPAEHDTCLDHDLSLPTPDLRPQREFGGQRFSRHQAGEATWAPLFHEGLESRDTGIAAASMGIAGARVVRATGKPASPTQWQHGGELLFAYVLAGRLGVDGLQEDRVTLESGDSMVVPADMACSLATWTDDMELLDVQFPGEPHGEH